jgi:hypothetical protein
MVLMLFLLGGAASQKIFPWQPAKCVWKKGYNSVPEFWQGDSSRPMTKPLWTLHICKNQQRGAETSYSVRRHPTNQAMAVGDAARSAAPQGSPHSSPQSWGRLSRVLEQVAAIDRARLDVLKKELDANGSADLAEVPLNNLDLRLIGFTDQ